MDHQSSSSDEGKCSISRRAVLAGGAAAGITSLVSAPAAAAGQRVAAQVKIGVVIDQSGPTSQHGRRQLLGIQFATEQVNGQSGSPDAPALQLVIRDTAGDPDTARKHAEELIDLEKVSALIGTSTVRTGLAVYEVAKARAIPMIAPISSESTFDWPYAYISGAPVEEIIDITIADLSKRKVPSVAILFEEAIKSTWHGEELIRRLNAAGIEIVDVQTHARDAQDLIDPLKTSTSKNPAAILVLTFPPFNGYAARDARDPQVGWAGPLYFSPSAGTPTFLEVAGPAAAGALVVAPWLLVANHAPDNLPNKQAIVDFVTAFEADPVRGQVGTYVGYGADAVYLAAAAFAATTDPQTANLVLQHVGNVGVTGIQVMTPTHHNGTLRGGLTMVTVQDGKWIPADT